MGILLIGIGALVVGFLLILLISATAPTPQTVSGGAGAGDVEQPHSWIGRLDAAAFARLLSELFAELKFEIKDTRLSPGHVDVFAVNPTPITGMKIYIRAVCHPPLGVVGEEEVRIALDMSRAEMMGKAFVATGGVFSPEAKAAAEGAPMELLDGPALMALIKKHLPPVAVARRI